MTNRAQLQRLLAIGCLLVVAGSTAACNPPAPPDSPASTPAKTAAQQAFDNMTDAERIGQLLMAGTPSSTSITEATLRIIKDHHVGSMILNGNSNLSVAEMTKLTAGIQQASTGSRLFIATDQEGGQVQRLRGQDFTRIPSAVDQGKVAPDRLRNDTKLWATQLKTAGVNVNLGPVLDTVPSGSKSNPPIGGLNREYGRNPADVTSHGVAVVQGLADGGIAATIKHFPGLGRVSGNPDFTTKVTDTVTIRTDSYLAPFKAGIDAGAPFVMMSTAYYTRIDGNNPAAFSHLIVSDMLRGDLGFKGIIISDDLGEAAQVKDISPANRAIKFITAGGDIVLTVDAKQIPAIAAAVLEKIGQDPSFKSQVYAAALNVLQTKHNLGLLS